MRQEDQAEDDGVLPVKAAALHQQHFFFQQQVEYELLVVLESGTSVDQGAGTCTALPSASHR